MPYKFKILSIDGGGIRGIIPAMILAKIEQHTGKQIFELFDLIAGTSTGGILALGLTKPNPEQPEEAKYTANDLLDLYKNEGKHIFCQSGILKSVDHLADQMLKPIGYQLRLRPDAFEDLFRPKYSSEAREQILTNFLGGTPVKKALKEVLIPSYDTELRMPIFFTSRNEKENLDGNFRKICTGFTMKQAAMATSAAPTYFPPYKVDTVHHTDCGYYSLVDGGVFANNPTSLAIMEVIIDSKKAGRKLDLDDILVVSLGTGSLTRKYLYDEAKNWGEIQWALPTLDIILDGQSESVDCQLAQLLPKAHNIPKQYYRFQAQLNHANDAIDDASDKNIAQLEELAKLIIEEQEQDLQELCDQLLNASADHWWRGYGHSHEHCYGRR